MTGTTVQRRSARNGLPAAPDEPVTLRVPRRIREAIRRIAAMEESTMEAVTLSAIQSHIDRWEATTGTKVGASLRRRRR